MKKAILKRLVLLLALAMTLAFASGCSTKQKDEATAKTDVTSEATESESVKSATQARTDIRLSIASEITSLDPYATTAVADIQIYRQIYETLFFLNSEMELEPRVAERYDLADDGMIYTFYLRQGMKFHNGDELKASDVVFSFERAKTMPAMANYTAPIDTVTAVDDYTIQVKTVDVLADALSQLN